MKKQQYNSARREAIKEARAATAAARAAREAVNKQAAAIVKEAARESRGQTADTAFEKRLFSAAVKCWQSAEQAAAVPLAAREQAAAVRLAKAARAAAEQAERDRAAAALQAAEAREQEKRHNGRRRGLRLNPDFTAAALSMQGYADLAAAVSTGRMTAEDAEAEARQRERRAAAEARHSAEAAEQAAREARAAEARAQAQAAAEAQPPEKAAAAARVCYRDAARLTMPQAATAAGRPITAAEAEAANCHVLAARLDKGTVTPEHAAAVLASLREIDGTGMAAAYTAEQAISAAVRALHTAENYAAGHGTTDRTACKTWAEQTGGTAFVRLFNLARQAEAAAAKAQKGRRYDRQADTADTLPDVWDSIQEAAAAIVEQGTIMAHRGGLPLAAGRKAGKAAAVVETFGRTHSAGREAARRFSRAQADKAATMYHIDFQTMDREQSTEAAAIAAATADAEQAAAEARAQAAMTAQPQAEADGQSMAREQAAAVSVLAADVVAVLIHWPEVAEAAGMTDAEAAGMPSNRAICRTIAAGHAAAYIHADTAAYLANVTEDTGRKAIDRALQAIAKSGTAAALRQSLREDAEAARNGRRLLYC